MRIKLIIAISIIGLLAGLISAYIFGIQRKPQPPVFAPVSSLGSARISRAKASPWRNSSAHHSLNQLKIG